MTGVFVLVAVLWLQLCLSVGIQAWILVVADIYHVHKRRRRRRASPAPPTPTHLERVFVKKNLHDSQLVLQFAEDRRS